jgi:hypothetical protein
MPPRLYYWLALGGTATAIGVALMVNHLNIQALVAFIVAFALVVTGGIGELLVPFLIWQFGRYGKGDRALRARIKLGESLLKQPAATQDECTHWDALTQQVLRKYIGGEWHPIIRGFLIGKDVHQPLEEHRRIIVAEKIHDLIVLRKTLENRGTIVIHDRNIKLSKPSS